MVDGMIRERGERFGLHYFGSQSIVPGASAAARAVFDACGGAAGWKSWVAPSGKMIKLSLEVMARFLDDNPDAPAEELYRHVMAFPGGDEIPDSNIWDGKTIPWDDAPPSVRGAYETFRFVYLRLWVVVRTHDAKMARALPRRAIPRLVQAGDGGQIAALLRLRRPAPPALDDAAGDETPGGGEAA